ncbi:MAG: hypothetical protein ACE5JH_01225 [Acidobacteriota bacterium]
MSEPEADLQSVVARLEGVVRQNRRLRYAVALILLFPALAWLRGLGLLGGRRIEAQEYVLRDTSGTVRARWGLLPGGSPILALYDAEGDRMRAALSLFDDVPSLTLYDRDSKARASLSVSGETTLRLFDETDAIRAQLGVGRRAPARAGGPAQQPSSWVALFDREGRAIWSAP